MDAVANLLWLYGMQHHAANPNPKPNPSPSPTLNPNQACRDGFDGFGALLGEVLGEGAWERMLDNVPAADR